MCVNECLLHTVHLVAFYKALILLVNGGGGGTSAEGLNVVVQIPAQVLIKYCGHEMEFFVIVFLHEERREKGKVSFQFFNLALWTHSTYFYMLSVSV